MTTMMPLAHTGRAIAPHDLWGTWTSDASLLLPLVGVVLVYGSTVRRSWRSGGRDTGITTRQVGVFAVAVVALAIALVSPLDALSRSLFAAHMTQHLLLTLGAAPLLLLGRVHLGLVPAVPLRVRRRGARVLARAVRRAPATVLVGAVGLHVGTVLVWHVPVLYDAAVRHPLLHRTEHVTLLLTAMGFWAVMGATRPRPVAAAGLAAFVASLVSVLLAAAMTSATAPWYESHLATTRAWGLAPLDDQHMAAAILWVPGGLVYLWAAAAAIHRWIRADEQHLAAQRRASGPVP